MKKRTIAAGVLTMVTVSGLAGSLALGQEAPGEPEVVPRRISILLTREPIVSVTYTGRYGPMRLIGTLVDAPETPLRLEDWNGRTREAHWPEIRELSMVRTVTADLPAGSFTVALSSDPGAFSRTAIAGGIGYLTPGAAGTRVGEASWRLRQLPEGELRLRGAPFGETRVPIARITDLVMQPISGSFTRPPEGTLRLEVEEGVVVDLNVPAIQALRRDMASGVATVTLTDGQIFTGKLVRLPDVAYELRRDETGQPAQVPFGQIAQMEILSPPGETFLLPGGDG